jgi:uncharacterized protein (DUF2147 family)
LLHINPVAARSGFVKKTATASLNKRLRLGDLNLYRLWLLAGFTLAGATPALATPMPPFTPGYWTTAGHEIVLEMAPCGPDLCGFIAGIALSHPAAPMPKDWRGRPQCGDLMLRVSPMKPAANGWARWTGVLQDPRNGNVYHAAMQLDSSGNFHLHGYIGIPLLGESQIWPKFNGEVLPGCRVPELNGK